MKHLVFIMLLIAVLFGAISGCSTDRVYNHRPDQVIEPVGMNEVVYVDHSLNREYSRKTWLQKTRLKRVNISLEKSVITNNSAGYRQVTSMFRNHTNSDYVLEARTHFFDESELPSDVVTKWKRVFIPANSIQVYKAVSVDQATAYFRTEVRSSK